jgi:hypothetical protein
MYVGYTESFSVPFFLYCWIPMYVGGAKYSECEYFDYIFW